MCKKGDKCKFSHDLNVVRKVEKRNVYEHKDDGNYISILTSRHTNNEYICAIFSSHIENTFNIVDIFNENNSNYNKLFIIFGILVLRNSHSLAIYPAMQIYYLLSMFCVIVIFYLEEFTNQCWTQKPFAFTRNNRTTTIYDIIL